MCNHSHRFIDLGRPRTLWAVGAVHGDVDRLSTIHSRILESFRAGDRLIYLGNVLGYGGSIVGAVDELLDFRRYLLSYPGLKASDIVYLRGAQEEMWQKLLQIQFAPDPRNVLAWMGAHGVPATVSAYRGEFDDAYVAAREGVMTLTRWTNALRAELRGRPGHIDYLTHLRRAAYVRAELADEPLKLVLTSAGLDISRALEDQGDDLWWGKHWLAGPANADASSDQSGTEPAAKPSATRAIRGFDPKSGGVCVDGDFATLDGNCGRMDDGVVVAGHFASDGELIDLVTA